ncbi:MAG: GAF domain-containing protein [Magnetococcales bacterium]|nr:GAF domain-containing protein [Magnetococcales bacterium]
MWNAAICNRLLEMQLQLGPIRDGERLSLLISQFAAELVGADRAALFILDWERMQLRSQAASGVQGSIRLDLKMGIVGLAFLRKEIVNVVDAYHVPFFNRDVDLACDYRTGTVLVVPLTDGQRVLGAVQLLNKQEGCFTQADEERMAREVQQLATPAFFQTLDGARARLLVDRWVAESECERGTLFVLDLARGVLHALYATGMSGRPAIDVRINLGIAGWVVFTGQALRIDDAYQSEFFNAETDRKTGYRTRNMLAVPLLAGNGEPLGVVEVINKQGESAFTEADREVLQRLAALSATALETALLLQEHEAQFHSFMDGMAASLDARDAVTAGRSQRVSRYACGMAQEMGLSASDVDVVRVAGCLHEYGKSRDRLSRMRFSRKYRHVPAIAAAHHEYMEGSGDGSGVLNRYIPFLAKIVTVAEIFEALTAERPYRKRMSAEEALFVLRQGVGKKFDAAIVDALERYWQRETAGVVVGEPSLPLADLPVTPLRMRPVPV